tara:strand:+ start:606 stop:1448 length:843 start_codon:yes stop_codon:yes gene_type:complete
MLTNVDNCQEKVPSIIQGSYICECGKIYKHRQSLSLHKKKCDSLQAIQCIEINDYENTNNENTNNENTSKKKDKKVKKEILKTEIVKLMTENNELKKQIGDLIPKIGNTNNTINNINQKFNVQIFLNEQCKDAINMNDFIKSIEISLDHLDITKNNGLANGLSNAIIENMNKLSLYERPLHCTDVKRETLYIKDNDSWEKDKSKEKIKKAIKNISNKQYKALKEWTEINPDFNNDDNKQKFFAKTLSIIGKDIDNVDDKIIKNLCNNTYIKDNVDNVDNE